MFDIACLIVTAFVGYYGGQQSKARWLGSGLLFLALGSLIFISPHFIIGPYKPGTYSNKQHVLSLRNDENHHSGVGGKVSLGLSLYPPECL